MLGVHWLQGTFSAYVLPEIWQRLGDDLKKGPVVCAPFLGYPSAVKFGESHRVLYHFDDKHEPINPRCLLQIKGGGCDEWEAEAMWRRPTPQQLPNMSSIDRANTVMVDHDPSIGTLWLTIAPDCDWVNARSTSKASTRTLSPLAEEEVTGTTSSNTAEKKTNLPSNGGVLDTIDAASGLTSLKQERVLKRKRSFDARSQETGSSSDETSTIHWIRCSGCQRLKRFDYAGVLQNLYCQLRFENGN